MNKNEFFKLWDDTHKDIDKEKLEIICKTTYDENKEVYDYILSPNFLENNNK